MNRESNPWTCRLYSVPRACGDEPAIDWISDNMRGCSPRLRG